MILFASGGKLWAVPTVGQKIMIVSTSPQAVEIGTSMAKQGGNVVDVAIATALTMSVTSPYFASLGGGGFALVSMNDTVEVIDFRENAPLATSPQFYSKRKKGDSFDGGAAVGVPGIPLGLWELHKRFGKLRWAQLLRRPIELAKDGFEVNSEWTNLSSKMSRRFTEKGKGHFFKKDGSPYLPGDTVVQKPLSELLITYQTDGPKAFYSGENAKDLIQSVKSAGGVITQEDLDAYKVRWLSPMKTTFQGYEVFLMPPPSSGGVVLWSALKLADFLKISKHKPLSVAEIHSIAEILNRSFRGRTLLGDPDFHRNPIQKLTSDKFLGEMAKSINPKKSVQLNPLNEEIPREGNNTTHLSVMDSSGNAVAMTLTINVPFGSGVVTEKFGVALNNEMDDFTTVPHQPNSFGLIQGSGNWVQPKKRPLSSMSPTIVRKNGQTLLSIGGIGGPRIISGVFQTLYRVLVSNYDIDLAIQTPRVHNQFLPKKLFIDGQRFSPEILAGLRSLGHNVTDDGMKVGVVLGIFRTKENLLHGAFDSRNEGAAGGY